MQSAALSKSNKRGLSISADVISSTESSGHSLTTGEIGSAGWCGEPVLCGFIENGKKTETIASI